MAGDVRPRQNHTQPTPCGGSPPVSAATTLIPSSLQPNGTTIHSVAIKQKCADASKLTNPSHSLPGSANASPTPDGPAMSHSASMHHTLSPSTNQTNSTSLPSESPAEPSQSFVKNTDTLVKSPPTATESSSSVATSSSSEAAAVSATTEPPTPQEQPTPKPSLQLPGLAAANPPDFSKPIAVEATPSTTSPPLSNPPPGEAAAPPAAQPESAEPPEEDEDAGEPLAAAPAAPTQSSGQDTALPSEILNPSGASDSADPSSAPSTLTTDTASTPSRIAVATSASSSGPASSGPASSGPAPTSTNSVGGPAPTKTPPGSNLQLQNNNGGSGPPMGMIIGAAVGGAAALAIIALLIWFWRRRANKKKELGRPLTPLTSPGHQPADTAERSFAAGRQASTRSARHPLQGWWTSHGVNHGGAPVIPPEQGEKQLSTNLRDDDPFSDTHSTEAQRTAPILTPHQQQLRGILKQPAGAILHGRYPSDAPSIGAAGAGRRSRAHSINGQRGRPPSQPQQQRPAASRRTSSLTQDPFDERRTKFRSDPFDLELDTRMLSSSSGSQRSDARASSVYSAGTSSSSQYTSGVSSTAWTADVVPGGGVRSGASDSPTLPRGPKGYVGVGQAI